jgi:esterase/lipase
VVTRRSSLLACILIAAVLVVWSSGGRNASSAAPAPASSYAAAVAMIAKRQARDDRVALPGARSILLVRGARTPRAFVLLHGLTDSPLQFAELARQLYADGSNVFVPRFPRHGLRGADARALGTLEASQLRGFSDSVVSEAAGLGDSVVVVGLSMGGTAAAWLAQQRVISRAVLIAPALEPGRIPAILDRPIIGLADRIPSMTWRSTPDRARPDRELGFSMHAIAEILELGGSVLRDAARTAPRTQQMVLLVNANDRTVRESAEEALAGEWTQHGAAVSVLELPDSLRLPHNVVDPPYGRPLGTTMILDLLRELAYGEHPSMLVRALPMPTTTQSNDRRTDR